MVILNCNTISQYQNVPCIFEQINVTNVMFEKYFMCLTLKNKQWVDSIY